MRFRGLLGQTVTIRNTVEGSADAEGNWAPGAQSTATEPCFFQQLETKGSPTARTGESFSSGVDQVTVVGRLFLLPTSTITARSEVDLGGERYQVDGQPSLVRTPRGPHHVEARLRRPER